VERQSSAADRRLVELTVSPTGAAITERTRDAARAHLRSRLATLTDEQRATIVAASEILRDVFAAEGRAAERAASERGLTVGEDEA
jgi:DNA-binding MarR family transcriptional regulator